MGRYTCALAALIALGCNGKDGDDTGSDGGETGAGCSGALCVEWGADAVELIIEDGSGEYWFGMAETGCADEAECWYGEDCIFGDLTGNYHYCHPASSTGVSLYYGGSFADLQAEQETVFGGPEFEPAVTYYVESDETGECWIWGEDPSYYAGLGCTEL